LVLALALICSACAVDRPAGTFDDQERAPDAGLSEPGNLDRSAVEPLDSIDGTWLVFGEISTCVSIFEVEELLQSSLYIVETETVDPPRVTEVWDACDIELSPILGLQSIITSALLAGAYPITIEDGMSAGGAEGAGYTSGPLPELWGLEMVDPLREPFPDAVDDARIVDSDLDGQPGATLLVSDNLCETYLAQRSISNYQGQLVAPDEIRGSLFSVTEQLRIDATTALCQSGYETQSNQARSTFTRIRVDGRGNSINLDLNADGAITCDEVVDAADALFERHPPDHDACAQ